MVSIATKKATLNRLVASGLVGVLLGWRGAKKVPATKNHFSAGCRGFPANAVGTVRLIPFGLAAFHDSPLGVDLSCPKLAYECAETQPDSTFTGFWPVMSMSMSGRPNFGIKEIWLQRRYRVTARLKYRRFRWLSWPQQTA